LNTKKILVPFDKHSKDIKSLYHAFALAERIKSKIFVLFFKEKSSKIVSTLENACLELVHSACEEELSVSFHITRNNLKEEFINFIKSEHIDLIVLGDGDTMIESVIKSFVPKLSAQIIKVKIKK
jgi:K+-sensing histidine kinase KdpD